MSIIQEQIETTRVRGFAAMDPERRRIVAQMGGRAAHVMGAAHEFTAEEARAAGRLGGIHSHQSRNVR